jgi:hypothetical protein
MNNVIEIPALTYLDAKYGEEKVDAILEALKQQFGMEEVDYLMSCTDESDIEFVIEEVI